MIEDSVLTQCHDFCSEAVETCQFPKVINKYILLAKQVVTRNKIAGELKVIRCKAETKLINSFCCSLDHCARTFTWGFPVGQESISAVF